MAWRGRWAFVVAAVAVLVGPVPVARGSTDVTVLHTRQRPAVRPGPSILYRPPARAPQLENASPWRAAPILVSGASAYRDGEFLYQDWIYDDHGAGAGGPAVTSPAGTYTYPDHPDLVHNAADFVELRLKLVGRNTAIRITYNSMIDPSRVASTIGLGESATARPMPHGANAQAPAEVFVTVHGEHADAVDAASGQALDAQLPVTVDRLRRQVTVVVPDTVFDARRRETVRIAAATGLWDPDAGAYLVPGPTGDSTRPGGATRPDPAAFFNVAFRYGEPLAPVGITPSWAETRQAAALASGDLTPFAAHVEVRKLLARIDDDMADEPGGVPRAGPIDRIYASQFEPQQGRGTNADSGGDYCGPPSCVPPLAGQLQPYGIYVPDGPVPASGYGVTLMPHPTSGNHNTYMGTQFQRALGKRGTGSIVITGAARGPVANYFGYAGADIFEIWADAARHYPLDSSWVASTGSSGGGWATHKYSVTYPDLFGRTAAVIGRPSAPVSGCKVPGILDSSIPGTVINDMVPALRNLPVMDWVGLVDEINPYPCMREYVDTIQAAGFRYEFWQFPADHIGLGVAATGGADPFHPIADWLGTVRADPDPAHVSYVLSTTLMHEPEVGLEADHAYWVSGLALRDDSTGAGSIDVRSSGFALGDPPATAVERSPGVYTNPAHVPALPYLREAQAWGPPAPEPAADALHITARNIRQVTIDVARARVTCRATLDVDTDGPLTVILAGC